MTTRTDIARTLARAADPVEPDPTRPAWSDPEGQATFQRIITDDRTKNGTVRQPRLIRRRLAVGAALAGIAGAAVAVVGLPGTPNHGGASGAWAVAKHPDGSITVTIKDNRDPAGLQAALRDAGLPAEVTAAADSCVSKIIGRPRDDLESAFGSYRGDPSAFHPPYTWHRLFAGSPYEVLAGRGNGAIAIAFGDGPAPSSIMRDFTFTVHPHALPPGDVVNIGLARGRTLLVDVEKAGTPLQCLPPGRPVSK